VAEWGERIVFVVLLMVGLVAFVLFMLSRASRQNLSIVDATVDQVSASSVAQAPVGVDQASSWIPKGGSVMVAGRRIDGGMLYVGGGLRAIHRRSLEPALVVPSLHVAARPGDRTGSGMGYWPSYCDIDPEHRAGTAFSTGWNSSCVAVFPGWR